MIEFFERIERWNADEADFADNHGLKDFHR